MVGEQVIAGWVFKGIDRRPCQYKLKRLFKNGAGRIRGICEDFIVKRAAGWDDMGMLSVTRRSR
jgi:hypothetical protein